MKDFETQLRTWRKAGDRLFLFMDANEHIIDGELNMMLAQEGIDLEEITHKYWPPGEEPNTHIEGKIPIDGGWKTPDIEVENYLSLSFEESSGDHRTMIAEITTRSAIGEFQSKIVRPQMRRLTTRQQVSVESYNSILDEQFAHHRIIERLEAIDSRTKMCGFPSPD